MSPYSSCVESTPWSWWATACTSRRTTQRGREYGYRFRVGPYISVGPDGYFHMLNTRQCRDGQGGGAGYRDYPPATPRPVRCASATISLAIT
jgi:hypothetical protein